MSERQRVVITGLGAVSPLGHSVQQLWDGVLEGRSGVGPITQHDASAFGTRFAGEVTDFDLSKHGIPAAEVRRMDTFIQYGLAAAIEAMHHADLQVPESKAHRAGVYLGSGIGGIGRIQETVLQLEEKGPKRISPFFIPSVLINLLAGQVAIHFGLKGANIGLSTACTTGTHAIGLAARAIAWGDLDVVLAGGAEYGSCSVSLGGFQALRALSTRNDDPEKASRPFDKDRDGFVIGDGAGVLVLESLAHAQARGAPILAELKGFGMSCDAHHITQPTIEGSVQAMDHALRDAGLNTDAIQAINAHATSTLIGDRNETAALKEVFGPYAKSLAVSATKSMTGHLLGAAGAIEAVLSVLSLQHQVALPTINLDHPDEGCDLDYVPHEARNVVIENILSNSFGFGGTNGTLIFGLNK